MERQSKEKITSFRQIKENMIKDMCSVPGSGTSGLVGTLITNKGGSVCRWEVEESLTTEY